MRQVADKTMLEPILTRARADCKTTAAEKEEPIQSREIQKVATTTETMQPRVQVKR
jgi:hypothetical protein